VQYLLDGKILREQVDKVLKAIDSVGDSIERADACRGMQHIVMASIQIGIGSAATPAKRKILKQLVGANLAKRIISEDLDRLIAEQAGPFESVCSNKVAGKIAGQLNKQVAASGHQELAERGQEHLDALARGPSACWRRRACDRRC
jgi:hypothetical protein